MPTSKARRIALLAPLLLVVPFLIIFHFACGNPDEDIPVLRTDPEYDIVVDQVEKTTLGPFKKAEDRSLTSDEEHGLRVAANKVKGLIAYRPEMYNNYFIAGKIAYLLQDYPTALVYFDQCVQKPWPPGSPKEFYIQTIAECRYFGSRCFFLTQDYQRAADEAQKATLLEPKSILYKMAEARAELQMKHDKTANGILNDVLKKDPFNIEARKLINMIAREPG